MRKSVDGGTKRAYIPLKEKRMEDVRLKITSADHRMIKSLAAKAGKTIRAFMSDLIAAYKGRK